MEVDGSEADVMVTITVSSVSANMDKEYVGQIFQINGDVKKIVKVKILSK